MREFNVVTYDFNRKRFERYDVIPYFVDAYENTKKSKRPKTFEDFKKFVEGNSMYQFWARCEYEIILSNWPVQDKVEKVDVHWQVMNNIDLVAEIVMSECKELNKRMRAKKTQTQSV